MCHLNPRLPSHQPDSNITIVDDKSEMQNTDSLQGEVLRETQSQEGRQNRTLEEFQDP